MKKIIITVFAALFVIGVAGVLFIYLTIWKENSQPNSSQTLIIQKDASFEQVLDSIEKYHFVQDINTFKRTAEWLDYPSKIKAGKYLIKEGENNYHFINRLILGQHYPVKFTFNNIRTKAQFIEKVKGKFLFPAEDLQFLLDDPQFTQQYGFTPENILVAFIPDSYEIYYDIDANQFFERLYSYYQQFWNNQRVDQAQKIGLTPIEVSILASIVDEESNIKDEKPIIAGLYINRLHQNWNLEADPTVKFAVGDFSLKRILYIHTEVDSPYNTYKYGGLPPGPIRIPEKGTLDNVLNYTHHRYMFMCAKEDLSGRHNFAATLSEHNRNAARYHEAINKLK